MATLNSPGVVVQVIDESFYTPAAAGTAPMIFVATAQDKTNPSGTIAAGTTKANAGKVWLVTGQRDLTDTFGTPVFYTDVSGNPLHGNELNEYGLQAAYSSLGVSSRSYVVRADIDLAELAPQSSAPLGEPVSGTYWLDTASSVFGIKEWNSITQKFTVKTPIVLHDDSPAESFNGSFPSPNIGQIGDYCVIVTNGNEGRVFFRTNANIWTQIANGFDSGKSVQISEHYNYPNWNSSTLSGSVWITTTPKSNGANWNVKYYSGSTQTWNVVSAPIYSSIQAATYALDPLGGGQNISVGSLFVDSNYDDNPSETANFKLWRKNKSGTLSLVSNAISTFATNGTVHTFTIEESQSAQSAYSTPVNIIVTVTNATTILGSLIPANFAGRPELVNVTASFNTATGVLTIGHKLGGNIKITSLSTASRLLLGLSPYDMATSTGTPNLYPLTSVSTIDFIATNWKPLVFESKPTAPFTDPADGTLWYSNVLDQVDIMVNTGTAWAGYANVYPNADPIGPIISSVEPTKQSDGTDLVDGDIWIDTSDLENYGKNIYVYNTATTVKWVLQDTTDQSTPDGWVFADARYATTGDTLVPSSLGSLRASNYVDPDAPDPLLYPRGIRLWNTRRSGFNVKKYVKGHINTLANNGQNIRFQNQSMTNYETDRWVAQYTTGDDGSGVFGRRSQRQVIVKALKALIDTNIAIRDTDTLNFNLIAAPGYPELISNMVAFNIDRGITGFVVGDTPFRLAPNGTALNSYGLNSAGALETNEQGAASYDEYMAMYYPSGYATDNTGNNIVVPASHMMLRTFINNDSKAFLWFAPAGTRRGTIDNATSVGYIGSEGEFIANTVPQNLRDVLYTVNINPISNLTGVGLVAYGQKTRARNASALDRVNVARLVAYLRRQLDLLSRPFLFEPNDAQTRREIKAAAESLLLELVGQRALYDFVVVCDETNNTPARIDRNELYMDIAVEPVKAVEFIYIPLRIKNKGDIAAGL
jgi:hypothetical protein